MMMETSAAAAEPAADQRGHRGLPKQKSSSSRSLTLRGALVFLATFIFVLVLLQILALRQWPFTASDSPSSSWTLLQHHWEKLLNSTAALRDAGGGDGDGDCKLKLHRATSRLRDMITFLPLKDEGHADKPQAGTTWFMSSLEDTYEGEQSQFLHFPSTASNGRLLCLAGSDRRDGTKNSYALAWPEALPANATLLPGLAVVSEAFFGHGNIYHGQSAMMPFVGWYQSRGCAALPARWVLYSKGELRTSMAPWVRTLVEATLGQEMKFEDFGGGGGVGGPSCFEEAVVFRHDEGKMSKGKRTEAYDMMRCKARAFCNISPEEEGGRDPSAIRMLLLLRTGARSFKNDSAVTDVFRTACGRFEGCSFTVAWTSQWKTFCDQVRTMSAADVLVSSHGAQLTNMILMNRNSSIMEFFPKGWLELAGPGQYVYHWLASSSGMRHRGAWRDPDGVSCPFQPDDFRCFLDFFKDQRLGHDAPHFANWTAAVLRQAKEERLRDASMRGGQPRRREAGGACSCGSQG